LHASLNIIRVIKSMSMRWAEHITRMGNMRKSYRILVGKPKGTRPLGRPRRRWEDNIRMDLAQDRDQRRALVSTVMNLRVP